MIKPRIEHKIIEEKNYFIGCFFGGIWIILCLLISSGAFWLINQAYPDLPVLSAICSTLFFCYGVYQGIKSGFFDVVKIKEVVHVINEKL